MHALRGGGAQLAAAGGGSHSPTHRRLPGNCAHMHPAAMALEEQVQALLAPPAAQTQRERHAKVWGAACRALRAERCPAAYTDGSDAWAMWRAADYAVLPSPLVRRRLSPPPDPSSALACLLPRS